MRFVDPIAPASRPARAVIILKVEPGGYWPRMHLLTKGVRGLSRSSFHRPRLRPLRKALGSKLGTEASADDVATAGADRVILATGSRPARVGFQRALPMVDRLPGVDRPDAVAIHDVLDGTVAVGQRVVVLDDLGDWRGLGSALFLAERGHEVTIVTSAAVVGGGLYHSAADGPLRRRFTAAGGVMQPNTLVTSWDGEAALVRDTLSRHSLRRGYILHVGTLQPRKNLDALVSAYESLPAAIRAERQLVIVGKYGWSAQALVTRIERHRRDGRVKWIDYVAPDELRALGFSRQKALATIELARAMALHRLDLDALERQDDATAVARLRALRGVGGWTAEYVLLRGLGRLHVFPGDDVGARNNLQRWLGLLEPLDYDGVQRVLARWAPFQGLVYLHLLLWALQRAPELRPAARVRRVGNRRMR